MPDLSHLWQRFVLAAALVFGLALGVAATIFGYSNTRTVDIGFSVVHLRGIPLWTVAIVPLVVVLAAGTLYHWWNSLHHFSEHMRHRHRVRELEAEVASLKSRLDELLEMPGHAETATGSVVESVVAPVETLESLTTAVTNVSGRQIPRVIVAVGERRATLPVRELLDLRLKGIKVEDSSLLLEKITAQPSWKHRLMLSCLVAIPMSLR